MQILKLITSCLIIFTTLIACKNNTNNSKQLKDTQMVWDFAEEKKTSEQCPCCDYFSLEERGKNLICPICFWNDNGQNISELSIPSTPNQGITLGRARLNFNTLGACSKEKTNQIISPEEREKYSRIKRTANYKIKGLDSLQFFDVKIKEKFITSTFDIRNKNGRYFAIAKSQSAGNECWIVLSKNAGIGFIEKHY